MMTATNADVLNKLSADRKEVLGGNNFTIENSTAAPAVEPQMIAEPKEAPAIKPTTPAAAPKTAAVKAEPAKAPPKA